MGNIGTTATLLLIMVLFLAGISFISDDISKNQNLDTQSITLLSNLGAEYNDKYHVNSTFGKTTDPLLEENSTACLGEDAFFKQSCLDKDEIQTNKGIVETIFDFPELFLTMFGIDNENLLLAWKTAFIGFITFLIGLQLYKALRTGEVD